jgi:hypothetical protein
MAAKDHLATKLFHGTNAWIPIGGTINPGRRDAFYPDTPGAYATSNLTRAKAFSREAEESAILQNSANKVPHQLTLFHPVYEVEHLTEHSDPDETIQSFGAPFFRDPKGFRIKGIADYEYTDTSVLSRYL